MTVYEKIYETHEKIKSFEYIETDIDNGMLAFLGKDIRKLRDIIGNATAHDKLLKEGDKELYLNNLDASIAVLYKFTKQSTPEIRLSKLPLIKLNVDIGVDTFFDACKNANSNILLKEESEIPDVSNPYTIKDGLTRIFGI